MWVGVRFLAVVGALVGVMGEVPDPRPDPSLYNIGVGIYDVTGPAAGVNMMGYANPAQINAGIHMRLYSRAFLFDDTQRRFVFVSVDCGMMATILKIKVMEKLTAEYGDQYSYENIMVSGTHTHSGPGGYMQYLLFDLTSLGFIQPTLDAMTEGIFQSIKMAHENVVPGRMYLSSGELLGASINRSPTGYLGNPEEERAKYEHDTDKLMTLLRLEAEDGTPLGLVNWFAVHPTSMNNTNTLISSDNKGYASQLFEEAMNPPGTLPGQGKFVAAFAQSNCGDVSPNIQGPKCIDTGLPCEMASSTCDGRVHNCIASGPGKDMVESTKIIGTMQFEKAWDLYHNTTAVTVSGPVQFVGQTVDMSNYTVDTVNGSQKTCLPALGYSFAAGTIDGPGAFDFSQGTTESNPFWDMVSGFLHKPSEEQVNCHAPKPILLDTGEINFPYPWHPRIMETQIGLVGQLAIMPVPGEFTTMCGRRFRDKVSETLTAGGIADVVPVLAGLSNVYSHYITTFEEYQVQRYEAASTIFGPHTCAAYGQHYTDLATAILNNEVMPAGPPMPDLFDNLLTLLPGVFFDGTPLGSAFGDVVAQPYPLAYTGETVTAKFVSGHPRNDVQLGGSFLTVERLNDAGSWEVIATDASWQTRFIWDRVSSLLGTSLATVKWDIPENTPEGTYRLTHTGHHKTLMRGVGQYQGASEPFQVKQPLAGDANAIAREAIVVEPVKPWWIRIFVN